MADRSVTTATTIGDWQTAYNLLATDVGDLSTLVSGITDNTSPDDVVNALNYLYTLATTEDADFLAAVNFADAVTMDTTLAVTGVTTVGTGFKFATGPTITAILDEDTMSSDSATALATQQSIKAYIDTGLASGVTATDSDNLGGIAAAQYVRKDADSVIADDISLDFGSSSEGGARLEHNSTNNTFTITPYDGGSFDTTKDFRFDADNGYWDFVGALVVGGLFTSQGIDDNATSNKLQLENSAITLKTATTVQGNLTLTSSGTVIVPTDSVVTNSAGEYLNIDGSSNEVGLFAGGVEGVNVSATAVSLLYAGSAKIATLTDGVAITGQITLTTDIVTSSTDFDLSGSNAGNKVRILDSDDSVNLYGNNVLGVKATPTVVTLYHTGSAKLATASGGVSVTGTVTSSGNMILPTTGSLTNGGNESLTFTSTTTSLVAGGTTAITVDGSTVELLQNTNVTGDLDVTGTITYGTLSITNIPNALTVDSLVTDTAGVTVPATGAIDNGSGESVTFSATTVALKVGSSTIFDVDASGANVTGDLAVSGTITGTIGETSFGNISTGTITASGAYSGTSITLTGNITLPSTGTITNGVGETIEFETSTIDFYTSAGLDFRVGSSGSNFYGTLEASGLITAAAGLTLSGGNIALPSTGQIQNGSGENIVFSATTVTTQIASSAVLQVDSAGIDVTGEITATGDISAFSDAHLKENLAPIDNALDKLKHLVGMTYNWNDDAVLRSPGLNTKDRHAGLLAQSVNSVLPEAVKKIDDKYLALNYNAVVGLLVNAIKELKAEVDELKGNI